MRYWREPLKLKPADLAWAVRAVPGTRFCTLSGVRLRRALLARTAEELEDTADVTATLSNSGVRFDYSAGGRPGYIELDPVESVGAAITLPLEARDGELVPMAPRGTLSDSERGRLAELEDTIGQGLDTFIDVGVALLEIRDLRLYRDTHRTFAGYVSDRWGFSRAHAYRAIDAAQVAKALSPNGDDKPNAAQARELAPLTRRGMDRAGSLFKELRALHGDHLTASIVRNAVHKELGRPDGSGQTAVERGETRFAKTPQNIIIRRIIRGLRSLKRIGLGDVDPGLLGQVRVELPTGLAVLERLLQLARDARQEKITPGESIPAANTKPI